MTTSRSESINQPSYGRKRSNTVQSFLRSPTTPATPLSIGDAQVLSLWVHDASTQGADVVFNPDHWPGVSEGDMVRVTAAPAEDQELRMREPDGFLFVVQRDDTRALNNMLQISVPKSIADTFDLRNHGEVKLTKVDRSKMSADYIEIVFQDQYLGRCDMWRLSKQLQGQCVHVAQEVSLINSPAGKIQNIYIGGKNVSAGYVTTLTKAIFRSLTAKITIFIQVCRELWEFAGDGERYNEKIVHSFLPALFQRWREAGTNHIVTIVLISRVFYEDSEIGYAAGPLQRDDEGRQYKDFFKVVTDLEVMQDWKSTLVSLKDSFWAFQRDILLTHHYHRAQTQADVDEVRLVGRISFAHEGPILEALNLTLNPIETLYVDRSFCVTGASIIVITPGTGYYRVSKPLLRLTTTRLLDQGFGVDLVSLAKPPLHQTPIFSFKGYAADSLADKERERRSGGRSGDPLWGGDEEKTAEGLEREKTTIWWEPFWVSMSFWDQQMDLPFREDRFVARAKMHQIEMLGLLEHDVLSSIQIEYLSENGTLRSLRSESPTEFRSAKQEADAFDNDRFSCRKTTSSPVLGRESISSSVTTVTDMAGYRPPEKRPSYILQRSATAAPRIAPIEESPRRIFSELPPEDSKDKDTVSVTSGAVTLQSSSPSTSSLKSRVEKVAEKSDTASLGQEQRSPNRLSLGTKLTSSWIFNPFRSAASQPAVVATASASVAEVLSVTVTASTSVSASVSKNASITKPITMPLSSTRNTQPWKTAAMATPQARTPRPMAIRSTPSRQSTLSVRSVEDELSSSRGSLPRRSPSNMVMGISPRDENAFLQRRSTITSLNLSLSFSSSPVPLTNPLRAHSSVPYTQSSLASRWRHMFPQPFYKHQIKWKSMVTPGCLPLTTEYFPTKMELETCYDNFTYEFIVDPQEMRSFFIKSPLTGRESVEQARQAWALVVMRSMAALRIVQGFQFIIRPAKIPRSEDIRNDSRTSSKQQRRPADNNATNYNVEFDSTPKPAGVSEIFSSSIEPVFLSMSNEIHRISYNGEAVQVKRYVRRMPPTRPMPYKCLVWPKLGVGYTELVTAFGANGLENYNWNRLDMLIAGYEKHFNESLRYWRTRFIVIPTNEPTISFSTSEKVKLDDEETRLLGSDKLAELFSKLCWNSNPSEDLPPVRFLPTYLGPTACVIDDHVVSELEEIHRAGPLGKKPKSERDIADLSLPAFAKLILTPEENGGLGVRDHRWHTKVYQDSFTGYDLVSWLVKEFRDVSTREQGAEWGLRLQEQGLIEHCRGKYPFFDGHYFYRLCRDYAVPSTPRSTRWFRPTRHVSGEEEKPKMSGHYPGNAKPSALTAKRNKKRLVLSQTIVVDFDPQKRSDQAEMAILHYDLIHNPANVFHFELNWLGTTARCIEDVLRLWGRTIERYGLRLVESYVSQIADVRQRNPFQSCCPIRLSVPPPIVPDLEKRLSSVEAYTTAGPNAHVYFFEYALLRKFGFVLDIEAAHLYPNTVDVFYSYRRSSFDYSQFVHRSGVAFVQVVGGAEGFLFLTNRLMAPGRFGPSSVGVDGTPSTIGDVKPGAGRVRPAEQAEALRVELARFCQNREALTRFYDEKLDQLPPSGPEEPPPLSI